MPIPGCSAAQGYMAEAITAGLGYSWSCLGVPAEVLQLVATVAGELLDRQLAWQPDACTRTCQQQEQQQGKECEGGQLHCAVGSKRPRPSPFEGLAGAAAPAGAAAAAGGTAPAGAAAGGTAPAAQEPVSTAPPAQQHEAAACIAGGGPPAACQAAAGAGQNPGAAPEEPVDVLACLLAAGHKLRELKEQRFEDVSYGQLRLALAHLGRCNPGPWE